MRELRGVFFDLYGTLLVFRDREAMWADWLSAFHSCLREHGLALSRDELAARCDSLFGAEPLQAPPEWMTVYERRIKALCDELGVGLGGRAIQQTAAASAMGWQRHIALDADAVPVLRALKRDKVLALISNFDHPPHVHRVLARHGLAPLFDSIVVSAAVGVKKPDPAILRIALRQTGLTAEDVAFVGDSPEDMEAALAAGAWPICIERAVECEAADAEGDPAATGGEAVPTQEGPVTTIRRLTELLAICAERRAR